jgi:hypothetical protein
MNKDTLREEIAAEEGVVKNDDGEHVIYLDHLGLPTFGIGALVKEYDPEYGCRSERLSLRIGCAGGLILTLPSRLRIAAGYAATSVSTLTSWTCVIQTQPYASAI